MWDLFQKEKGPKKAQIELETEKHFNVGKERLWRREYDGEKKINSFQNFEQEKQSSHSDEKCRVFFPE